MKPGLVLSTTLFIASLPLTVRADYRRYRMTIVENGGFECTEPEEGDLGAYWLIRGRGNLPAIPSDNVTDLDAYEGSYAIVVSRDDTVWQYLPGAQEYADSLKIRGAVKLTENTSTTRMHLMSGDSLSIVYCFAENPDPPQNDARHIYISMPINAGSWVEFTLPAGMDFLNAFGSNPLPRFTLILEGIADHALFDALDITTDIYTLPPEELKEAVLDEMEWNFEIWIERGLDR